MIAPQRTRLEIRRASADDIALIRSLADEAFRDTYREILSEGQLEYMLEWMYSEAALQRQMGAGHVYFIAELDDTPCGYVSVQPLGLQDDGAYLFELQKIYVLPSFKGEGIGSALYGHISSFVKRISGRVSLPMHSVPLRSFSVRNAMNSSKTASVKRMGIWSSYSLSSSL